jgi:hypothetical protein
MFIYTCFVFLGLSILIKATHNVNKPVYVLKLYERDGYVYIMFWLSGLQNTNLIFTDIRRTGSQF